MQRAPGIPCALLLFGANDFLGLGRIAPRERGGVIQRGEIPGLLRVARNDVEEGRPTLNCHRPT